MKTLFFVALAFAAVAAEPEADSDALSPYSYGFRSSVLPYTSGYAGVTGHNGYAGYPYITTGLYGNRFFKREAEADSDALLYRSALSPYSYGFRSSVLPYTSGYAGVTGYNGYAGYPYTTTGLYGNRFFKREAEAESDPELVYTNGNFHTNLRNIHKGVHNSQVTPYSSVYNAITPFTAPSYYNTYSGYHGVRSSPFYSGLYY